MTTTHTPRHPLPTPDDEHVLRRRRQRAGVALIAGAATMGFAEVLHPRGGENSPAGLLEQFAQAPGTWTAWGLLLMATALLQLPGVLAWRAALASGRGARLVGVSGLLLAAALVALFAFGQSHGEGAALTGGQLPIDPALIAAYTRADSSVTVGVMLVLVLLGFHLGWALLFAGLARAGALPVTVAVVGGAAAIGSVLVSPLGGVSEAAAFLVLAAAIAFSGERLARTA